MIYKAQKSDSLLLAILHYETINQGFLSKLGVSFLQSLYDFLILNELVLVYKEKSHFSGFISCSFSSRGIMKRFLFSSPFGIFKLGIVLIKNPKLIKPLLETYNNLSLLVSDTNTKTEIPETELLSICVSPKAQQGGIGSQLLNCLEKELKNNGISRYKVIAGEKLKGANRFYKKNGFELTKQITIHGNDISNVYIKKIE